MQAAVCHSPQHHPGSYRHFEVMPASGALGAEVEGVDLRRADEPIIAEIEQALTDHLVLFIRDQQLDADDLEAFAGRMGRLMRYPMREPLPDHPHIMEFSSEPDSLFAIGGSWHSDSTYFERPPKHTVLYCIECPAVGGDTSYANQYLAWETLSEGLRAQLESASAVNSSVLSHVGYLSSHAAAGSIADPIEPDSSEVLNIENVHPVARTHPVTGRKALYVNDAYTAHFVGMPQQESLPLLRYLWQHSIVPDFTCRFRWRPGTLAIWDNRCCMHYGHNDIRGQRRVMRRLLVEGERPV